MSASSVATLEAARARGYCAQTTRLLEVARAGSQFPEPRALRHLLWAVGKVWPRKAEARVEVLPATGWPALTTLEQLGALHAAAVGFFDAHGARPAPESRAFLTALAAEPLPPLPSSTAARLVSREKGGRRFVVVHERYAGQLGLPVRFTFHLTDAKQRYLSANRDGQATVTRALAEVLDLACEGGAEEAFWGLSSLEGAEVSEVVMGALGPFELPGFVENRAGPLAEVLPQDAGALHLVVERAACDVAADGCRDPFGALMAGEHVERRRAGLGYRVFRERRVACTEAAQAALELYLRQLGQPLVVRSR